jgi:hypothetical protein
MRPTTKLNAVALVALVVMLFVGSVYVASLGPAYWAKQQGLISHEAYMSFYAPLHWVGRNCQPLKNFGDGYLGWWG